MIRIQRIISIFTLSILLLSGGIESVCYGLFYSSDKIESIAKALSVNIPDSSGTYTISKNGRDINIRVAEGEVKHIGYRLFPEDFRGLAVNPVIADFVERYWLEQSLSINNEKSALQQMREDRFQFYNGSLASVDRIQKDLGQGFSCNLSNNIVFMEWGDMSRPVCKICFPVNHELILGRKMKENDSRLPGELKRTRIDVRPVNPGDGDDMASLDSLTSVYIGKSGSYLDCELRSDRFFMSNSDSSEMLPVFNPDFPVESLSNLFTDYDIDGAENIALSIRHKTYGFNEQLIETSVPQFVAYSLQSGCQPYVGIIDLGTKVAGMADMLVIMRNWEVGYNHVLRVSVPIDCIAKKMGKATARLNAFVPTGNLKNLFND